MGEDIMQEGRDLSTVIRDGKTFSYMDCKLKKVSCIQFQPSTPNYKSKYIAVSYMENLLFDERVVYSMKSHKNMIVLWDFDE